MEPWLGTMVVRCGGFILEASTCVRPLYEVPHIPVLPFVYGRFASHSMVSYPSGASNSWYL